MGSSGLLLPGLLKTKRLLRSSYGFFLLAEPIVGLDIPVEVGLVIRLGKAVAVPDNQFEDQVLRPMAFLCVEVTCIVTPYPLT